MRTAVRSMFVPCLLAALVPGAVSAQTRTPSHVRLRFCHSSSITKCGGCVCAKVSSSKLMRGCPAPIMRCVTNLSLLPKWQERHNRACATGSLVG